MKKVELQEIEPGMVAKCDYYSHKQKLLIGKGTEITEKHIESLYRRNIFNLYVKPTDEEAILDVMSKEIEELEELDIEISSKDYDKYLKSKAVEAIESKIGEDEAPPADPTGIALKTEATQLKVSERSEEYLEDISTSYEKSVEKVRFTLNSLVQGNTNCAKHIKNVITHFTRIFLMDKNILLNISNINPGANEYIYYHSLNVCILSINIAASYGYNKDQVIEIGEGALLHDVGMLLIPQAIRHKDGRYDKKDWYEIQKHPILALHLLEKIDGLPETAMFTAYQVHERVNGSGYPKQRGGHLIHRYAKLVQIADIYEALSSPRPHRKAFLPYEAVDTLIKMTNAGMISSEFVKAFITYTSLYPIGSLVLLDNQCVAKVVDANHEASDKPVVSVLTDGNGSFLPKENIYQLDLNKYTDFKIVQALSLDSYKSISIMDGF